MSLNETRREENRGLKRPLVFLALIWLAFLLLRQAMGLPLRQSLAAERYLEGLETVQAEGVLEGLLADYAENSRGMTLTLEGAFFTPYGSHEPLSAGIVLVYYTGPEALEIGMSLQVFGRLCLFEGADNPGQFDARDYYLSQDMASYQEGEALQVLSRGALPLRRLAAAVRGFLQEGLEKLYPAEEAGILSAMLLGERRGLADEVQALYQQAGLSHLLSVSGLHVGFWVLVLGRLGRIIFALFLFAREPGRKGRRLYGWLCFMTTALLLGFYMLLSGSRIPVKRAGLMALLAQLARAAGFSYDLPSALALSALLVLIPYPYALFQSSFQLSFGCILLLGVLLPWLFEKLYCESRLSQSLMVPVMLQMGMLPFTLHHYYCFYPYSVAANLLALPWAGLILSGGMLSALLAWLPGPWGMLAAGGVYWLLRGIRLLCEFIRSLPLSAMAWGQPDWRQSLLYMLLMAGGLGASIHIRKKERARLLLSLKESEKKRIRNAVKNARRTALFLYLWTLGASMVFLIRPPGEMSVTALAVGQGDCYVIELPEGGAYLVDGGSGSEQAGERILLPYLRSQGIKRLDSIIVSHPDKDHINCLDEVLKAREIQIGSLILPLSFRDSPKKNQLEELALARRIPLYYLAAGDGWEAGGGAFSVLYPGHQIPAEPENNDSLVFLFSYGSFSMLFTGDLGELGETQIAGYYGDRLPEISILKLAHHGSRFSNTEAFLDWLVPKQAVVSCGRNNPYGHPAQETRERLEARQIPLWRTDRAGAIRFTVRTDGTVSVHTYHSSEEENFMKEEEKITKGTWIACGIILAAAIIAAIIMMKMPPAETGEETRESSIVAGEDLSEAAGSSKGTLPEAEKTSPPESSWPVTAPAPKTTWPVTAPAAISSPDAAEISPLALANGGRNAPEKDPGQAGFVFDPLLTDQLYLLFASNLTNNTDEADPFRSLRADFKAYLDDLSLGFLEGKSTGEDLEILMKTKFFVWESDPYQLTHNLGEAAARCYAFAGTDMEIARERILLTNRSGRHYLFIAVYRATDGDAVRIYMVNALIY